MDRMTEEKVHEWVREWEKEKGGRKREQEGTWEVTSGHSHGCEIPTEAWAQTSTFCKCLPKHILEFNAERYGVTEQMHKEHFSGNCNYRNQSGHSNHNLPQSLVMIYGFIELKINSNRSPVTRRHKMFVL